MAGTTNNVGVRVFSDLSQTVAAIQVRDGGVGICLPVPGASAEMTKDEPFVVDLTDPTEIEKFPAGTLARDTLNQYALSGVTSKILFVRAEENEDADTQLGLIAGEPAARTGMFAFKDALTHTKFEPSFLLAPGYGANRPGDAANPVVAAMDTVCDHLIDCMGVFDTPVASVEAALEAAEDFKATYNIIACYPQVVVNLGGANVTRPMSTHVVAEHLKRDKEVGNPFKAAWNRPLKGVLGPSTPVGHRDGDTSAESNTLCQGGIVTMIEGNLLWGPFTTATDPTTIGYRSIKRIRTRRAVEKATLKAMRKYNGQDLGPHVVTLIYRAAADFLDDLVNLGALVDYELVWEKAANPATLLEAGGLRTRMRFAETPDLVDLMIYSEPQPEAFDLLAGRVGAALNALGNNNIRVAV